MIIDSKLHQQMIVSIANVFLAFLNKGILRGILFVRRYYYACFVSLTHEALFEIEFPEAWQQWKCSLQGDFSIFRSADLNFVKDSLGL